MKKQVQMQFVFSEELVGVGIGQNVYAGEGGSDNTNIDWYFSISIIWKKSQG